MLACLFSSVASASAADLRVPTSYPTVQAAINAARAGDSVIVSGGVYDESIMSATNGTAANPIIIDGQNVAVIKQATLKHAYLRLQNFRLTGVTNQGSFLIYVGRGSHFCVISNNVMDAADQRVYGIQWAGPTTVPFGNGEAASDCLVISNTVKHCRAITLMSIMGDRNVIKGNYLLDSAESDFFRVWGRSNIITGNVCSNNFFVGGLGYHPDFIQTFGNGGHGSIGHIIERNVVMRIEEGQLTQLSASLLPSIRDWTFRNNVFVDIALQASCSVQGIKYYNNTFVRCNYQNGGHVLSFGSRDYNGVGVYDGSSGTDSAHGTQVINNIFLDCGDARNTVGWYAIGTELTNVIADYNFVGKNGFQAVRINEDHVAVGGEVPWNGFRWWEPNGINGGDPRFVNATMLNFHLRSNSPLIGAGKNLSVLFTGDFDGKQRSSRWDIGAFTFDPATSGGQLAPPTNLRVVPQ